MSRRMLGGFISISILTVVIACAIWSLSRGDAPTGEGAAGAAASSRELPSHYPSKTEVNAINQPPHLVAPKAGKDALKPPRQQEVDRLLRALRESPAELWARIEADIWQEIVRFGADSSTRELIGHWIVVADRLHILQARTAELVTSLESAPNDLNLCWISAAVARRARDASLETRVRTVIGAADRSNLERLAELYAQSDDFDLAAHVAGLGASGDSGHPRFTLLQAFYLNKAGKSSQAISLLNGLFSRVKEGNITSEEKGSIADLAMMFKSLGEMNSAAELLSEAAARSTNQSQKERLVLESLKVRAAAGPLSSSDRAALSQLSMTAELPSVRSESSLLLN